MTRLPEQPGERIDRRRPIRFTFDGKKVEGFEGDTIVSALYAGGRRTFSRSFKYHRPRGELCACGQCGNSLFQIAGAPGIRGCGEPARDGLEVHHQNAWPSLDFDVMRAVDKFGGPFTPVGFYYKTFIRPRRLWPLYEKILRNAAGLGTLPKVQAEREWRTEYRRRHCDLMVIGGGLAGLSAAVAAARAGADVVLCDEDAALGGERQVEGAVEQLAGLVAQAQELGVELLSGAPALGYFDGLVAVWQGDVLHQVRARQHIVATGALQQSLVFSDNDVPGVMLSGGARRLGALYGVKPGERAVVATVDDRGVDDALALRAMGVQLVAVADLRAQVANGELATRLADAGVRYLPGSTIARALSTNDRVSGAVVRTVDHGRPAETGETLECDLVALSGGSIPALSLLLQAGGRAQYDEGVAGFAVAHTPPTVHVAGAVAGHAGPEAATLSGRVAAARVLAQLGLGGEDAGALSKQLNTVKHPSHALAPPPYVLDDTGKAFVDLDEDVTVKDVKNAAAEGYDSLELSKRYTTLTMGPSQGRYSQTPAARVLAAEMGLDVNTIGLTTARPPWVPVPMGVLAGRPIEPAKRSSIHGRHRALGATVKWAGDWRRAYDYGDPEGEALAVHRAAGLIDVSTLGKLLVRGADAGAFLDRLYPNRLSNLAPGRTRYGVISSDAGRIVDDGTIARIDDDTFYVTTTSSGAGAMEEWFSWWLADWGGDVAITDLTQGVSAVNLAGPKAREIMAKVTDMDCSADAFQYMDARQAVLAGVQCLILRIGFVGEVGYEIHFPSAYGQPVWDALMEAGAPLGLRPFGLEPQRILRLQKMHILVGQDTDSESTPFAAAMPWIVKLDKEGDFIGRWALEHYAEQTPTARLVGFTVPAGNVPTEGAVVLDAAGTPAGQVTSARRSPVLNQTIGLAWVPDALAADGARITISDAGQRFAAEVQTRPFYDPDGEVLRS